MKLDTVAFLAALIATSACKHKHDTKIVDPGDHTTTSDRGGGSRTTDDHDSTKVTATDDDGSTPSFAAIYFELDSSEIDADGRHELDQLGAWLEAHPNARITIEGNTDDRGTDEYNLALGDRRAQTIRTYLARLGVDEARLATISYGEERPRRPAPARTPGRRTGAASSSPPHEPAPGHRASRPGGPVRRRSILPEGGPARSCPVLWPRRDRPPRDGRCARAGGRRPRRRRARRRRSAQGMGARPRADPDRARDR
jgi:peptidoglycan-associated lipoprotein